MANFTFAWSGLTITHGASFVSRHAELVESCPLPQTFDFLDGMCVQETSDAVVIELSCVELGIRTEAVFAVSHAFIVLAHELSHLGNELGSKVSVVSTVSA